MPKKIRVDQLRLGMHVLRLEGSWLAHPFWKTSFLLDNPLDLEQLRASGVLECWIDTALGLDVQAPQAAPPPPALAVAPPPPSPPAPAPVAIVSGERALAAELKQAAAICNRGREAVTAMFNEARMGRTLEVESCLPLVQEISGSVLRHAGALISLARLKSADDYTYLHSVAVCALMVVLSRKTGLDEQRCREAGLAGLTHDVGKALMPLQVLNKPGRLTEVEFGIMRGHPEQGHALLAQAPGMSAEALDVVLHHHERIDGEGYPHRLAAEQIPTLTRMGAICDVYDAITSNRPYKAAWDPAESIARMASWKGHFDPALFAAFVHSLGIYPTGSLVRLASGALAVVVEQNPANLVSPVVKVFYSTKSDMHVTPRLLDLSRATSERIVGREEQSRERFAHLDELWADPETLQRLRA